MIRDHEPDGDLRDDEWPDEADASDDETALVRCPACRRKIAEDSPKCPACGEWITGESPGDERRRSPAWMLAIGACLAVILFGWIGLRC